MKYLADHLGVPDPSRFPGSPSPASSPPRRWLGTSNGFSIPLRGSLSSGIVDILDKAETDRIRRSLVCDP